MSTTASDIVTALDDLILAKLNAATDVSSLFDRRLSELGISAATSLEKLTNIREKWAAIAARDTGFTELDMRVF